MARSPIVSVVIEMGTLTVTGRIDGEKTIKFYISEVRRSFSEAESEIFFVGAHFPPIGNLPRNCFCLSRPQAGYYGWKNAGAEEARGKYVAFWDSDCRPGRGYLKRAVGILQKNPRLLGVAGLSRYNGSSFWSRLDTVTNYGYLYQGDRVIEKHNAASHNMVIRREGFPVSPFGPYDGRVGGDVFLCRFALSLGRPLALSESLVIFHERHDVLYSVKNYFERHLRDVFQGLIHAKNKSRMTALAYGALSVLALPPKKFLKVIRFGPKAGFNAADTLLSAPVLALYGLLDLLAFILLVVWPPFLGKFLLFQYGRQGLKSGAFRDVLAAALASSGARAETALWTGWKDGTKR